MFGSILRLRPAVRLYRGLATATEQKSSVFGDLTAAVGSSSNINNTSNDQKPTEEIKPEDVTVENDAELQAFLNPKPYVTVDALLSPLKRELYQANILKHGFFKNNESINVRGEEYKMKLSRAEVEALEPSVYLRSWRIKSSVKKTNIVLRALKGLPLKKAITQCHFMEKKVAGEVAEMLERGVTDAQRMNYDISKLYVDQSWVHTDGQWARRVEWKGRGRMGILTHRYVSVRVLLKSEQTQKRLAWEAKQRENNRRVVNKISDGKIKGSLPGYYRW